MNVAFIIAAPRSGTTFLEEVFNQHPDVCGWHEPFFIWEYLLDQQKDDYLDETQATRKIIKFVREEFSYYMKKSGKPLIIEKTPSNAFKIRYINHIFPEAKWIHLYRDGRDVIASMKKRYQRRKNLVNNKQFKIFIDDIIYTLKRQPYWRHRLMAIWHEIKNANHLAPYKNQKSESWQQSIGWGPRYPGWQKDKQILSEIEMMATQWVKCEEHIHKDIRIIDPENVMHLQYEKLLASPLVTLEHICNFIDVPTKHATIMASTIKKNNSNKWLTDLTPEESDLIALIIKNMQLTHHYDLETLHPKNKVNSQEI